MLDQADLPLPPPLDQVNFNDPKPLTIALMKNRTMKHPHKHPAASECRTYCRLSTSVRRPCSVDV